MWASTKYLYRSAGIGDVLWTEPIIRQLAARHKRVVLFTLYPELFNNYPLSNVAFKALPSNIYRTRLKILNRLSSSRLYHKLDGVYEAKPKQHMLHTYQEYFGLPKENVYPKLYLTEEEKTPLPGLAPRYVVLHLDPNVPYNYRKVFGVDWNEVVQYLRSKSLDVIATGTQIEKLEGVQTFKGSIRDLIRLIYHSSYFIGVDSGPSHIAASLQKPSLIFFGSVNPLYRHFPEQFNGYFLQQYCEFAGCYHEVIGGHGQTCRIAGDDGVPKCAFHTTSYVLEKLEQIIDKNLDKE